MANRIKPTHAPVHSIRRDLHHNYAMLYSVAEMGVLCAPFLWSGLIYAAYGTLLLITG